MRKIIFIILMIFGVGIIGTGIFLQVDNNENANFEENKPEKSNKENFKAINKYNLSEICSKDNQISTYINTSNYTKISFNYPTCVHEYNLTFYTKILRDESSNISLNVSIERKNASNYMNEKKAYIIALKNEQGYEVEYKDIKKITTDNNIEASIIQTNYQNSSNDYPHDSWYIAIELEEELIMTFEFNSEEKVINYEAIEAMINSVKLENDAAIFKHSTLENGYQIGTIKENFYNSYEHGYKINYKIPKKYPEVDSLGTNINSAVFESEKSTEKIYVEMSIQNDNYDNFQEQLEIWKELSINSYNEDQEKYRNTKDTGLIEKTINNKKIYYFIYTYDYYLDNEKVNTNYLSRVFYEIKPQIYVEISIINKEVEVTENFISDFLNFVVEEY